MTKISSIFPLDALNNLHKQNLRLALIENLLDKEMNLPELKIGLSYLSWKYMEPMYLKMTARLTLSNINKFESNQGLGFYLCFYLLNSISSVKYLNEV